MRKRRKGITRLEVVIWLLCAAAVTTAVYGVHNAANGQSLLERVTGILTGGKRPFSRDLISILLLGVDERKKDVGRADTVILVWANLQEKKAAMLSIPRDTWCRVAKAGETKLAHAYSLGRVPAVIRAAEDLLGEEIDYYVKVNFDGIQRIVDAMGGVEIDVETRMYYRDRRGGLLIDLSPGPQRLNGYQAMCYVRYRGGKEADFGRMRRQKEFLLEAYRQLNARHTPWEIGKIAYQAWRNLDTNLSHPQVLWLSQNMKDLDFDNVKMESLPVTEGHAQGMSVLIPNTEEGREMARQLRQRVSSGFLLDRQTVKVQVLNGTKTTRKALSAARTLKSLGYNVLNVGNAPTRNYPTSKIFATREAKKCAEEMATALHIEKVFDKAKEGHRLTGPDIFLIVGEDWSGSTAKGP